MKKVLAMLTAGFMALSFNSCALPEGQTYAGLFKQVGELVDAGKVVAQDNGLVDKPAAKVDEKSAK